MDWKDMFRNEKNRGVKVFDIGDNITAINIPDILPNTICILNGYDFIDDDDTEDDSDEITEEINKFTKSLENTDFYYNKVFSYHTKLRDIIHLLPETISILLDKIRCDEICVKELMDTKSDLLNCEIEALQVVKNKLVVILKE